MLIAPKVLDVAVAQEDISVQVQHQYAAVNNHADIAGPPVGFVTTSVLSQASSTHTHTEAVV